ncbi:hypothetical protein [Pseudarthrobacter sp. BIM B-2242]|uniref:hypothetical protein n=1 Tax=Pseudarthrobacter sp. BIM B-2242 TaxID=2772401 RepID=UPI00168B6D29|nr:hypothetical protein [Pseudarthrobacter sp. BIM B-2242]QOD05692.1 hypothetical protein IDT60_21860 [Pseudarthrobacter sp. BIM B-2242]
MSGGSFDYLCEVASLKELLENKDGITGTAAVLRDRGHEAAAAETEAILSELAAMEAYVLARVERLRDVWKAAEWVVSGDWSEDDLAEDVRTLDAAPPFMDTLRIDTATGRIVK